MNTRNFPNNLLMVLPATLLLFTGCDKSKEDLALEAELLMQYEAIELVLEPGVYEGQMEFALNFNGQELRDLMGRNGYSMDQLKEFRFTQANLRLETPEEQTFDILNAVELKMTTDGEGRSIASMDPVPEQVRELSLVMADINVADLLQSEEASVRMVVNMSGELTEEVVTKALLSGKVVVQL